ncbi:hypothetical protein PUMCH_000159 [Australozyma saopauloensis]|uniref:Uncharacterized protein n=1 Tax=Australozyma saopauloensis TaxID=291208 RepID=A0AAX4H315_9ASCO|nr:hypothetical protein PUMCH_000159 [[Candida] saopauloensis]
MKFFEIWLFVRNSKRWPTFKEAEAIPYNVMPTPELPGFYYDEEKKKYFRIVNGDQRINSSYHNNTIRAENRSREFLKIISLKRQRRAEDPYELSREFQKRSVCFDLSEKLLQIRLGLQSPLLLPQSQLEHALRHLPLKKIKDGAIWEGLNENEVFISEGLTIFLTDVSSLRDKEILRRMPLGVHHISPNTTDSRPIRDVQSNGEFVLCRNDELSSLLRWQCVRGRYRFENVTARLIAVLKSKLPRNSIDFEHDKVFLGLFHEDTLHLLLGGEYLVNFDLATFTVVDIHRVPFFSNDNYLHYAQLKQVGQYVCLNLVTGLFVFDSIQKQFARTRFKQVIYAYFCRPFVIERPSGHIQTVLRIDVVTQSEIRTVDFDSKIINIKNSGSPISIHNGNEVKPLIQSLDGMLVVEESRENLFIVNYKTSVQERLKLKTGLCRRRVLMPRLECLGGVYYICQSDGTYAFKEMDMK